jgi:arylsulfatase A-like enzyme
MRAVDGESGDRADRPPRHGEAGKPVHDAVESDAPPIVLVSFDTLRADRLGAYGNKDGLTPNLDRFASEGILFENVYSQATVTGPSHASLFSSHYPTELLGSGRRPVFGKDKPVLAQILQIYGYATGAFVSGGDLNPHMGMTDGFDVYQSPRDFASFWNTVPLALSWIRERKPGTPFFAFVHGYDAHGRYLKPTPYGFLHADLAEQGVGQDAVRASTDRVVDGAYHSTLATFEHMHDDLLRPRSEEAKALYAKLSADEDPPPQPLTQADVDLIRGVYDGAVAYADAQFGVLMSGLDDLGLLDRAIVVIFADHGEQLGEEGLFTHCCGLSDAETHVPLIVRLPGGKGGGKRIAGLTGLIDVMPTLVELAGGVIPSGVEGTSLVPALHGEAFAGRDAVFSMGNNRFRSVAARSAKGRLVYTGIYATSPLLPELIDAAGLDGPGFVASEGLDPAERARLRTAMSTWLRSLAPSPSIKQDDMPTALRDELRRHGYWDVK